VRKGSPMSSRPMSFGTEGPKMSRSRMPTDGLAGRLARPRARLTAQAGRQSARAAAIVKWAYVTRT